MTLRFTPWDFFLHLGAFPMPAVTQLSIPGAPAFMRGLRALFVSDVHLRRGTSDTKLTALMQRIAAQQADIILLGGDYAEGEDQCARFFEALSAVSAPLGIYGVPGNNDGHPALPRLMARGGAQLLRNRSVAIDLPGGRLQIGGCDEHHRGSPQTAGLFSGEGYRILLSHFPVMPECGAQLMLSGHTHAGQINFFGLTPYTLGFERRFGLLAVRGLHRVGDMQLAVCGGVGVSKLPLRIGARPEMLLVKFDG